MDEQDGYYSAEEILEAPDITEEDVVIPEWGGKKVRVKSLTKEEQFFLREQARKRAGADASDEEMRGQVERLLITVAVIRPKFTEAQIPLLIKKRASAFERIFERINKMTGVTALAETDSAAVAEASKSSQE